MRAGLLRLPKTLWQRDKLGFVALLLLLLFGLVGLFGPWLPIGDPAKIGAGRRLAPPSWALPFGTDELGRSLLPRVVQGIRATFLMAAGAVAVTALLGTVMGMWAGLRRGWIDQAVARGADILFAFPSLLLGLVLAVLLGPGPLSAGTAISLATLPLMLRVVRAATLGIAGRGFVTAAEVAGAGTLHVLMVHVLPNILGPLAVQLAYALSLGMILESMLSFLGLGVQPPAASLGALLQQGSPYLMLAPWLVIAPGAVLSLAILSVNLLGDALRDRWEPLRERSLT